MNRARKVEEARGGRTARGGHKARGGRKAPKVSKIPKTFCGWCGIDTAVGDHGICERRLSVVDPPRYCPDCARRMVVQVTPTGWTARCSRHGERASTED